MPTATRAPTAAPRLVPRWLLAATALAGLLELGALAAQRASWMVTDLPAARPTDRRPRRDFTTQPGATPEEELANLQAELTALDRRARQRDEALRALERNEAQVRTGSYPETGDSLLEHRRTRLQEAAARDATRRAEIEQRIATLTGRG